MSERPALESRAIQSAFYIRLECYLFFSITRHALSAAVCAQLAVSPSLTGSMGEMLLMSSLLQNCSGLALFLLFGVGEGMFNAPLRALAASPLGLLQERETHSTFAGVAVEEVTDALVQTTAGTGYGEKHHVSTALQKAIAATTIIGKYAHRHREARAKKKLA